MREPTVDVTDEQVAFFREQGYLSLEVSLSTPDELAEIATVYDRLFAEMVGWEQGAAFDLAGTDDGPAALPQILGPSRFAPELKETRYYANAWHIAQRLLGPECQAGGDHAILKPARDGAETPWHQDEAYWNPALDYHSLSVWVPLQAATVDNGCLHFIPGSHRLEVLPHHTLNHDPRVHALEVDRFDGLEEFLARAVACPIPAGGATFHFSRTFHYAGPNLSDEPRRAHILGFSTPARERSVPRAFPWNDAKRTAREERRREWSASRAAG